MPNQAQVSLLPADQPGDQSGAVDWDALLRFVAWVVGGGLVMLVADWLMKVLADERYRESVEFAWVR